MCSSDSLVEIYVTASRIPLPFPIAVHFPHIFGMHSFLSWFQAYDFWLMFMTHKFQMQTNQQDAKDHWKERFLVT